MKLNGLRSKRTWDRNEYTNLIVIRQPLFVRRLARSPESGPGLQWCAAEAAGSAESPTGCWRNFVAGRRTELAAGPAVN